MVETDPRDTAPREPEDLGAAEPSPDPGPRAETAATTDLETGRPGQQEGLHDEVEPPVARQVERDTPGAHPSSDGSGVDRGLLILQGLRGAAAWSWRFLLVVAALFVIFYLLGKIWVGVLPVIMAVLVSAVLWPVVSWLKRHDWPAALAAGTVLVISVVAFLGILGAIIPTVLTQGQEIVSQAGEGLQLVRDLLANPPFNLQNEQVSAYVDQATAWLQEQSSRIAQGVLTGVSTVGSLLVTFVMTLVITFFILKDGDRFGPWVRRSTGPTAGMHLTEGLARVWRTLGGFIKAQAVVSLVDAVFIGLGLVVLGVPMAFVLALITFFAGFIPIVGAVTAGALAVLVALVSMGFSTAVWVLVIVLLVQQLEGNVLSPLLQSKAMDLHPALVILVVAAGGTRWGIVGAFLAVPVTAAVVSLLRYGNEHLDLRTGAVHADDVTNLTPEGDQAASLAEGAAPVFALRAQQAYQQAEGERGAARQAMVDRTTSFAQSVRDRILPPLWRRGEEDRDADGPDVDGRGHGDGSVRRPRGATAADPADRA